MNLRLKVGASNPPWGKGWPTAAILRWGSKSCASLAGESSPQSIKAVEKLGRLLGNAALQFVGWVRECCAQHAADYPRGGLPAQFRPVD
jgi:hypothetical protein